MPQLRRLTAVLALLASLLVVPAAFASGGSGGGGGTGGGGTSYAAINRVSAVAPCDAGTFVSATLDKGAPSSLGGFGTSFGRSASCSARLRPCSRPAVRTSSSRRARETSQKRPVSI